MKVSEKQLFHLMNVLVDSTRFADRIGGLTTRQRVEFSKVLIDQQTDELKEVENKI